jgi:hypothetical protein
MSLQGRPFWEELAFGVRLFEVEYFWREFSTRNCEVFWGILFKGIFKIYFSGVFSRFNFLAIF